MTDPRTSIISQRLRGIHRIIAVSSGKGGVGKSLIAVILALELSRRNLRVGLFDLDFTSPTTHLILGATDTQPKEEDGLVPPIVNGVEYMSLVQYTKDQAAPLRGEDTSNALIELLAVTRWSNMDYLIIDMPPGIGDAVLDLIRLVKRIEFLFVTTPSKLAFETVRKLAILLRELQIPVIGVIENMKVHEDANIQFQTRRLGLRYLGEIPFDPAIEEAIGNPLMLLDTTIAEQIEITVLGKLKV